MPFLMNRFCFAKVIFFQLTTVQEKKNVWLCVCVLACVCVCMPLCVFVCVCLCLWVFVSVCVFSNNLHIYFILVKNFVMISVTITMSTQSGRP